MSFSLILHLSNRLLHRQQLSIFNKTNLYLSPVHSNPSQAHPLDTAFLPALPTLPKYSFLQCNQPLSSPSLLHLYLPPSLPLARRTQLPTKEKSIKYYFNKIFPITYYQMTETRKATDVFQKSRTNKAATLSHLEQQVGGALVEAINHLDAENKKLSAGVYITKATEHTYQKDKSFILIYVNYRSNKLLLTPIYKKLVTELEKKLKKTVLVLSTRKIQSRWVKENKTQTRPNSRTLTAVYNSFLDELLLPGVIIGSRTRVRLDGSSFTKLVLDKTEQHFLEERVDAIKAAYKNLTHRDIEIEFQKESTYYTLKKGDRR